MPVGSLVLQSDRRSPVPHSSTAHRQGTVTAAPCSTGTWGTVTRVLEGDSLPGLLLSIPKRWVITPDKSIQLVWFWQSKSPMVRRQCAA